MVKVSILKIIVTASVFAFTACSSVPRFTSSKNNNPIKDKKENNLELYKDYNVLETVEGVASFYADKYHGRTTSNGETYNMYDLTAAHPTYPPNTIIRVTNLSNYKSTTIRVNDRMPVTPGRIIDLSYGTALELDMVKSGLAEVRLEILEWGND